MKCPCYNEETKTSCQDRRACCSTTCDKWSEYVEIRNKGYKERYAKPNVDGYEIDRLYKLKRFNNMHNSNNN